MNDFKEESWNYLLQSLLNDKELIVNNEDTEKYNRIFFEDPRKYIDFIYNKTLNIVNLIYINCSNNKCFSRILVGFISDDIKFSIDSLIEDIKNDRIN